MKKTLMLMALAGTAAVATAAPRESVTFTNVDSVGFTNDANNQVRTVTFTGSDGGGAYTAQYLTIVGSLIDNTGTGTWAREAVIEITPPNGQTFVVVTNAVGGYVGTFNTPANIYAVPIGSFDTAGTWTFRFSETFDDDVAGVDQTWSSIAFTLQDGAPPATATPGAGVTVALTNQNSDGTLGAGSTVVTQTVTGAGSVNGVQVVGRFTNKSGVTANNGTHVPNQSRIRITPPASTGLAAFDLNPGPLLSTGTVNLSANIPGLAAGQTIPVAGDWTFEFYEAVDEASGVDAVWQNVSFTFRNSVPPTAVNFPTLVDGGAVVEESDFVTANVATAAGTVNWLRVVVPTDISNAAGSAMDVDMVGSAGLPENDFSFALYNNDGVRIANSFNTGPGLLPQMSFGTGTRPRSGDGLPYDGQNPAATPNGVAGGNGWPAVPTGTYFLAVTSGDDGTAFGPGLWSVTPSTEANTPGTVRIRYYSNSPAVTPASTDLGTIGQTVSGTANMPADIGARFKWYKFTIPADATEAAGNYVDIDTTSTPAPLNDTNIALYDSTGALRSLNDDIAPGWGAGNPTGGNSAMSFGMGSSPRDYSAVNTNLPAGDGRDGELTAGTYYLQVSMCCAGYGNNRFWVVNDFVTDVDVGDVTWNIRTNFPPVGSPCGPADIGGTGGAPGSDNVLDNNDFIVFIDNFFNQLPSADVGSTGGAPGSDGLFDNNDFIVFIDQFFSGNC